MLSTDVESILAVLSQHQMGVAARDLIHEALVGASFRGHLALVQLLTPFCLISGDDAGHYSHADFFKRRSLYGAYSGGFLEVTKWLTAELKLVEARGRGTPCNALCAACCNGHLVVAQSRSRAVARRRVRPYYRRRLRHSGGRRQSAASARYSARTRGHRDVAAWLGEWPRGKPRKKPNKGSASRRRC